MIGIVDCEAITKYINLLVEYNLNFDRIGDKNIKAEIDTLNENMSSSDRDIARELTIAINEGLLSIEDALNALRDYFVQPEAANT